MIKLEEDWYHPRNGFVTEVEEGFWIYKLQLSSYDHPLRVAFIVASLCFRIRICVFFEAIPG